MRLSVLVQDHCSLAEFKSSWFGSEVLLLAIAWRGPSGHPSLGGFRWLFVFAAGGSPDEAASTP